MKPITPAEIVTMKKTMIPDFVIEAFNEMIAEQWDGNSSKFSLEEIINLILSKVEANKRDVTREELFKKKWLDVEPIYIAEGWKVTYDKPGWNESYPATYEFKH